jgi:hypothetical protein
MLEAFFTPVPKTIVRGYSKAMGLLGHDMKIFSNKFPDTQNIDVAIIGLGPNADLIRSHLYAYSFNFTGIEVADFGNLNHDGSPKNANAGLRECLIALKNENIIPIFIGENNNYSDALLKGIPYKDIDCAIVSPEIAFNPDTFVWKLNQKNKLFHCSFIGIQNFMNTHASVQMVGEIFSEVIRLGELKSNISNIEPLLRQADVFEFDLNSIEYSQFQSSSKPLPSGLSNREACAICRYAGVSNKISVFLLNQFELKANRPTDAMQLAQMVWYILDGIDNRFNDHPQLNHRNFTVYKCHANSGEDMVFLYSELTGRWWMQIPELNKKRKTAPKFIGCHASDYEIAIQGEVPELWYRAALRH